MMKSLKSSFQNFLNKHYRFYKDSSYYWFLWTFVGSYLIMLYVYHLAGSFCSERDALFATLGLFLSFALVSGLFLLCSVILSFISIFYDSRAKKEVSQDD